MPSVCLEKYKGLVSMKLCSECGEWYPNFDIAGQENDRCPACGIPPQSNEYEEKHMDKIVPPQVICIDDHPAEYWARSFIDTAQKYNDAIDIINGTLSAAEEPCEEHFGDSYVKIKTANREIQLDLPYVGDYTDGYAALAACIINALVAIDMQKTLDYIAYNWVPTDD